jgi:hypothetical protein
MTEVKKICFFNHYHNGDLFNSKSFIEEIISNINLKYYYAHSNQSIVLSDLNAEYLEIPNISHSEKFLIDNDILYVNTWIGCYFDSNKPFNGECTLRFSYQMFGEIYEYLNSLFLSDLKLKSIEEYFSFVDYSKFNLLNVNEFVNQFPQKKILFSNGPCLSGQCNYYGDMSSIIETCAKKNEDKIFVVTHKFNTDVQNIKFTDDILNLNRCDLNEISYISTFCDIIIGRNSGPFCFSMTKENVLNPQKTFYAFGNKETDCFCYGVDINCEFVFEYFESLEQIEETILSLVKV